jgi:hypothetical protein
MTPASTGTTGAHAPHRKDTPSMREGFDPGLWWNKVSKRTAIVSPATRTLRSGSASTSLRSGA